MAVRVHFYSVLIFHYNRLFKKDYDESNKTYYNDTAGSLGT